MRACRTETSPLPAAILNRLPCHFKMAAGSGLETRLAERPCLDVSSRNVISGCYALCVCVCVCVEVRRKLRASLGNKIWIR